MCKNSVYRFAAGGAYSTEGKRVIIANEQPREDARLRGGSLIEPCAIVPGAEKKSRIDVT